MINYNQLRVFYHVARHLSFTMAAEDLLISQPAVTRHIKTFEDIWEIKLYNRRGPKIYLTEEGKALFEYAKNVFEYEGKIEKAIDDICKLRRGTLRFGCPNIYWPGFTFHFMNKFKNNFPNIALDNHEGNSQSLMQGILDYQFEFAICSIIKEHPDVVFDHFLRENLLCIASPAHPLTGKGPIFFKELSKEPLIIKEKGSGSNRVALGLFERYRLSPNILMESSNGELIKNLVKQGKGISFLVKEEVSNEIKNGTLTKIPIKDTPLFVDLYLIYLRKHNFSYPAKAFLKLLSETLPGDDHLTSLIPSWPKNCQFITLI